jgi:hypothetical protein
MFSWSNKIRQKKARRKIITGGIKKNYINKKCIQLGSVPNCEKLVQTKDECAQDFEKNNIQQQSTSNIADTKPDEMDTTTNNPTDLIPLIKTPNGQNTSDDFGKFR